MIFAKAGKTEWSEQLEKKNASQYNMGKFLPCCNIERKKSAQH